MRIDVAVDSSALLLRLRNGEKRLAFAVVNALRNTALQIQQAEFESARSKFVIRKPAFFFGSPARPGGVAAKIEVFPSVRQARPYAEIAVGRASKGGPILLSMFEAGGLRKPVTPGAKRVAVPLLGRPARPSIRSGVPPAFSIPGLKLRKFIGGKLQRRRRRGRTVPETLFGEFGRPRTEATTAAGKVQWKGLQRTYQVSDVGIFQRIGPDREDTRLIHSFIEPPRLDDRLGFVRTAQSEARRWFREFMERETIEALTRAGFKVGSA